MSAEQNKKTVQKMWRALSAFDWETLKSCLHEKVHYEDVPTEDPGAHGPENVVKRLKIAFDHLSEHGHVEHHIAAEGDVVFLDHTETWIFKTGEKVGHTFCTMHEMKDGKIVKWSDYWDVNNFVSQFPPSFLEVMAKGRPEDFSD